MALEDSGLSLSVAGLVRWLNQIDYSTVVRTVRYDEAMLAAVDGKLIGYRMSKTPLGLRLKASGELLDALTEDGAKGCIIHAHGLWLMPNVYPSWAKRRSPGKVKLIHSAHGMLGTPALKFSRMRKRAFWLLLQRRALETADCLHATAPSEYEEFRALGLRAPVAIIPHGIDLPNISDVPRSTGQTRTMLSLGRIHHKKGLDRLVQAWARLEPRFPDWQLRIVGPAERGHDAELRGLVGQLGLQRLSIEGPVYGDAKTALYRTADVFVLPSLHENFSMTVAEALSAEVPVISTNGAPWSGLDAERCGWWIQQGVDALTQTLGNAMLLPRSELIAMGARGRQWMARDFGWRKAAEEMGEVYSWLTGGGPKPATVRTG
jgi:glycosyltransferase involved in cell wall biosynthesis